MNTSPMNTSPQPYFSPHGKRELHPIVLLALGSDTARLLKLSAFCGVTVFAATFALSNPELPFQLTASLIACACGLQALADLFHILARSVKGIGALVEAYAELVLNKDLNRSGRIGDMITFEPETKETIRFVPTNLQQRVIQSPNGVEIPKEDFVEFVRGLDKYGITRSKWVSENAKKPFAYKFASGREMTRELYDASCEVLEIRARVLHGRKQGTSGTLTAKPTEILNILGLE